MWCAAHFNTAVFLGVVYLMVAKPATGWSIAAVLIAGGVGVVSPLLEGELRLKKIIECERPNPLSACQAWP